MSLIPNEPRRVLDIGCAAGAMGKFLKEKYGADVSGVDYDPAMVHAAQPFLKDAWQADLNKQELKSFPHAGRYDLIICGDVLEHLVDPWSTLRDIGDLLDENGAIVVSLPNIGHYSTLFSLLFARKWPYRSRGIHDRTHLRFFTRRNLLDLYHHAGLRIVQEKRQLRFWESGSIVNKAAWILDFFPFRSFLTFQYLHTLRK